MKAVTPLAAAARTCPEGQGDDTYVRVMNLLHQEIAMTS
jgi:hypothetical protein